MSLRHQLETKNIDLVLVLQLENDVKIVLTPKERLIFQ